MTASPFPRTARVRVRADFDRIFKQGRRVALPVLALHFAAGDAAPRLGLAVSRKVDPLAVGRNRIKRSLREAFRHWRGQLAAGDYVVVARVGAAGCDAAALQRAFFSLLQRAGALPATATVGTMPVAAGTGSTRDPASESAPGRDADAGRADRRP